MPAPRTRPVLRLETGIHQQAAIALYERMGYHAIPPFGDYRPDPLSVFFGEADRARRSGRPTPPPAAS